MKKSLPDLDQDNSFYGDKANKIWERRKRISIKEEEELVATNRRRYKEQNKKEKENHSDA